MNGSLPDVPVGAAKSSNSAWMSSDAVAQADVALAEDRAAVAEHAVDADEPLQQVRRRAAGPSAGRRSGTGPGAGRTARGTRRRSRPASPSRPTASRRCRRPTVGQNAGMNAVSVSALLAALGSGVRGGGDAGTANTSTRATSRHRAHSGRPQSADAHVISIRTDRGRRVRPQRRVAGCIRRSAARA